MFVRYKPRNNLSYGRHLFSFVDTARYFLRVILPTYIPVTVDKSSGCSTSLPILGIISLFQVSVRLLYF